MASVVQHQAAGLQRRPVGPGQQEGRKVRTGVPYQHEDFGASRKQRPSMIGLVSGKGGVGKSALAVNLAVSAARTGAKVLLIDGDAGLTNADLLLGLVPAFDLDDWCRGECDLEELVCAGPSGLSLLLSGSSEEAASILLESLAGRGPDRLMRLFESYELVILDLGAGIGPLVLDLALLCERLWLVATPDPASLADAYAMIKKLVERSPEHWLELVVNRAADRETGLRTHQALDRLCQRFLGRSLPLRSTIPEDLALGRSVLEQSPLVLGKGKSAAARRMRTLAEQLIEEAAEGAERFQSESRLPVRTPRSAEAAGQSGLGQ